MRQPMTEKSASKRVTVVNPQGIHARPADLFARLANRFQADVEIIKERERFDGKSILQILGLAAGQGTELLIEARGPDADAAIHALADLVESGFAVRPSDYRQNRAAKKMNI